MRWAGVALLVLALGNALTYGLLTRPGQLELQRLERHRRDLRDALADQEAKTVRSARLAETISKARSVLEPFRSGEKSGQSSLRKAFLEAEQGLPIHRDGLELRPRTHLPEGFGGIQVRVVERGGFDDLVTYLDRLSGLKYPVVPVEIVLSEADRGADPLVLTMIWSALWPEEVSGS